MVHLLNSLCMDFGSWREGCPCHHWLRRLGVRKQASTGQKFGDAALRLKACRKHLNLKAGIGDGIEMDVCPLAGLRAVELACGAVKDYFRVLESDYLAQLLEFASYASDTEMQVVLADFESGRAHCFAYLEQKTAFWQRPPWAFAALAQADAAIARTAAKCLLDDFDRSRCWRSWWFRWP